MTARWGAPHIVNAAMQYTRKKRTNVHVGVYIYFCYLYCILFYGSSKLLNQMFTVYTLHGIFETTSNKGRYRVGRGVGLARFRAER